jgi:hypothetical protein
MLVRRQLSCLVFLMPGRRPAQQAVFPASEIQDNLVDGVPASSIQHLASLFAFSLSFPYRLSVRIKSFSYTERKLHV